MIWFCCRHAALHHYHPLARSWLNPDPESWLHTRAREEEGADREADEARQRVLQGRQQGALDESERPLRPNEKGFRCRPQTFCFGI